MTETISSPGSAAGSGSASALLHVTEEYAAGTQQPTTTAGWVVRPLNTVKTNEIPGASLDTATGILTLPPGTYEIDGYAVARMVATHRLRLWNITAAAAIEYGTSGQSSQSSPYAQTSSKLFRKFTLDVESQIRLEHKIEVSGAGASTLGIATVGGVGPEKYAEVIVRTAANPS